MMRRLCVCPGRPFVEVAVVPPVYRIVCVHPLARRPVHQRVWAMRAAAGGGCVCLGRSFVEVAVVPPVYRIVCVHPLARRPVLGIG